MKKKLIIFEIVAALVMAVLVTAVLFFVAISVGGNFMTDFTFLGERGYEATGVLGIIFGLPLGGVLGAYFIKRKFARDEQETSQPILIGLLVGVTLLAISFANQIMQDYDSSRFNAGMIEIESIYPEFKNLDCFASCSYKYDKDGDDYYFAYIVNGSGVPIAKATCFKVDKDSQVTKVGVFLDSADSYIGYKDINPKNCSGIK